MSLCLGNALHHRTIRASKLAESARSGLRVPRGQLWVILFRVSPEGPALIPVHRQAIPFWRFTVIDHFYMIPRRRPMVSLSSTTTDRFVTDELTQYFALHRWRLKLVLFWKV
ncbi:unnamed protein product [Linum trigynum]|uniref:Uncharacterized protein n=1 Tax=Linum trigynum TaxID=586398 RepID=A0AAV2FZV1_9ROSI